MHRRALTNGVVDQLFVTDHLQNGAATGSRPFLKLLDLTMAAAEAGRLRKHGGRVWRPVPGCPGAYAAGESFRDFLESVSPEDFNSAEGTPDEVAFAEADELDLDDEDDEDEDDDEDDLDDLDDEEDAGPPHN